MSTLQSTQTIPFASNMKEDPTGMWMTATYPYTAVGADLVIGTIFKCGFCHRIWCPAAGVVYVQRAGDVGFTPYTVTVGTILTGKFIGLGGTTLGTAAGVYNLELAGN